MKVVARGLPARPAPAHPHRRLRPAVADRAQGLHLDRAAQRPELRHRRPVPAGLRQRGAARCPGRATSRSWARCSAPRAGSARRPSWSSSSRPQLTTPANALDTLPNPLRNGDEPTAIDLILLGIASRQPMNRADHRDQADMVPTARARASFCSGSASRRWPSRRCRRPSSRSSSGDRLIDPASHPRRLRPGAARRRRGRAPARSPRRSRRCRAAPTRRPPCCWARSLPAGLVRALMRLQRSDVLETPFTAGDLARAATALLSRRLRGRRCGRHGAATVALLGVTGAVGGAGATTIAIELATYLCRPQEEERSGSPWSTSTSPTARPAPTSAPRPTCMLGEASACARPHRRGPARRLRGQGRRHARPVRRAARPARLRAASRREAVCGCSRWPATSTTG